VWWSVGLSASSLASTWLIGNKRKSGWLLGVAQQLGWLTYALVSAQWGFLISVAVFTTMNAWNYTKWKRDDARATVAEPTATVAS